VKIGAFIMAPVNVSQASNPKTITALATVLKNRISPRPIGYRPTFENNVIHFFGFRKFLNQIVGLP